MDFICPVCNGVESINLNCPTCDIAMEEGGSLQQFFDPYNPYISGEILDQEGISETECVHLVFCNICGNDKRVNVEKIIW